MASVGVKNYSKSYHLVDDAMVATKMESDMESDLEPVLESGSMVSPDKEQEITMEDADTFNFEQDQVDFGDIRASATHASLHHGINAKHLIKIWQINLEMVWRTLDITSQNFCQKNSPKISHNYPMNDNMLQYKCIKEYFFMDTFFMTKKSGKTSCRHTCCQLFVTNKGYIYVVLMKTKHEVM